MEPISIPSVPKEAFNKHRPISDLVKKQVEHFKHIEARLPANIRATLPTHAIHTENEAARYISAMTSYLRSQPGPRLVKKVSSIRPPVAPRPAQPISIAAAAASPAPKRSSAKKDSAPKQQAPSAKSSSSRRKQ